MDQFLNKWGFLRQCWADFHTKLVVTISEFFEISIGEMRQDGKINIIFRESGPALP